MDLIKNGVKMSEIKWDKLTDWAQYRWYITLSQLAFGVTLLSKLPSKDMTAKFFGDEVQTIDFYAALEYMKRFQLGLRDLKGGKKLIEKVIPFTAAISMGWASNL